MVLSINEQQQIVEKIKLDFAGLVAQYDSRKYPEAPYLYMRHKFHALPAISDEDIRQALIWKYGHWRKTNYPDAHKVIIRKVCQEWSRFVVTTTATVKGDFDFWTEVLRDHHAFITVCFLVHLLHSDKVAILDQHNFRAMNHLMRNVRLNWSGKEAPSKYHDLEDVSYFIRVISDCWSSMPNARTPDQRAIDKYLMVLGQRLKAK